MTLSRLYKAVFDMHERLAVLAFRDGTALPPLQVFFELTASCNLSCRFCFYRGRLKKGQAPLEGELQSGDIVRVVRHLPSARLVSFSGGEPLARADIWNLLGSLCRIRSVTVETNATMLDRSGARFMAKLGPAGLARPGLLSVDVSIHGTESVHDYLTCTKGAFQKAVKGLSNLLQERKRAGKRFPLVNVKVVVSGKNVGSLVEVYQTASRLGADHVVFKLLDPGLTGFTANEPSGPFRGTGRGPAMPDSMLRRLDRNLTHVLSIAKASRTRVFFIPMSAGVDRFVSYYREGWSTTSTRCSGAFGRLSVMPNGDYYICKLFGSGNAGDQDPMDAWNSPEFKRFRLALACRGPMPECLGCCYLEPLDG